MEEEIGPDGKKIRPGINPLMIDELTECNTMLSAQRKKRQVHTLLHSYKSKFNSLHNVKTKQANSLEDLPIRTQLNHADRDV
jgi:hypothetical protein